MSSYAETLAHTQAALARCADLTSALANSDGVRNELGSYLQAAFADTELATATQYLHAIGDYLNSAQHAVTQLNQYLSEMMARFQGGW